MTDYTPLQIKINDLKAKIEQDSITPLYLGHILDDIIALIKAIDMTDLRDDIRTAIQSSASALESAKLALDASSRAETSASEAASASASAVQAANTALAKSESALAAAAAAEISSAAAAESSSNAHGTVRFAAFVPEIIQIENQGAVPGVSGDVVYMQARKIFALRCPIDKYYLSWHNDGNTDTMYNESIRQIRKDKVFVCGGKTYVWSDDEQDLVETSADKADKSMFRTLSETEYESLSRKDEDTYYFIYE